MTHSRRPSTQAGILQALAEFRYALRSFLRFSEQAAQAHGLHPQQHQLLLQIAGQPAQGKGTIGFLAQRLGLRQNSVVELADRSVAEGLVRRTQDPDDHRRVVLSLTARGTRILRSLSTSHAQELDEFGPSLIRALDRIRAVRIETVAPTASTAAPQSDVASARPALRPDLRKRNASHTSSRRSH